MLPGGGRNGSQIETHFDRNLHQKVLAFGCTLMLTDALGGTRWILARVAIAEPGPGIQC